MRAPHGKKDGLARWIDEVVDLHKRATVGLRVEVVHDLRVAIRRCRSLAQGLREIDDDEGASAWKALSDAGRALFQGLGDLRDAQVMREHAEKLLEHDVSRDAVLAAIDTRIRGTREGARAAVLGFDPAAWRRAAATLPARADALLRERPLFDHLALRRFLEARDLHQDAMRSKSSVALHELRIGVKKLRYSVENFLPDAHEAVGKVLKKLQEVLGDIHDLDVLLAFLGSEHMRLYSEDRSRACQLVRTARDAKVLEYRALVSGDDDKDGAWIRIRAALADGPRVPLAHRALMLKKASAHGVTALDARRLERACLVLVRAFCPRLKVLDDGRAPALARWAAACALVDGGGKAARRFVDDLPLALGFAERDRELLAVLARAAARAPRLDDARTAALLERDRRLALALGALVHLAVGARALGPFVVKDAPEVVTLVFAGSIDDASDLALRRGPLESLLKKPVWWSGRPAATPARSRARAS